MRDALPAADQKMVDAILDRGAGQRRALAKTITDLTLQQTAYQAALGAAAKVVQPSLMDFLR